MDANSTRRQQMESHGPNIQRTSGQKLNKSGFENNGKEHRRIKEELFDDNISTIVHFGEDRPENTTRSFVPNNGPLKVIAPRNFLPTYKCHMREVESEGKLLFEAPQEIHKLEGTDDARNVSIDATTSAENEGSFNDPAACTVEENFDNAPFAWELDSNVQDGQIGRSLDDIGSQANDVNQLFLGTNEEEPSEMPVLNKEQSSEPDTFACLDCPAVFKTKKTFEKHISSHDDYRRYQCSLCEKRFKERSGLLRHKKIHSGERPFTCETCGKTFATKSSHLLHRKMHAGDKAHSCEFCGWKFIESSKLTRHLRRHTGIKPYRCLICKTRYFSSSKKWKRHVEKHHKQEYEDYAAGKRERKSTKKPYKCVVCGGGFQSPSELSRHERIHTGEKPHECNFCDRGFCRQDSFKNHLLTHSGSKPYLCIVCKIPFSTRDGMVSHKQQNHESGSETVNMNINATSDAVPNISTVQRLNPKSSVVTSHESNVYPITIEQKNAFSSQDGSVLENSTTYIEMSPEMSIDSDILQMVEVDSTQSGSSVRKRNASDIEENHPILVKKSTKKAAEISTIHAETCNDIEHSFLDNEITTDPLSSVPQEQVDDTNFMEESNAPELDASQRIQYKRRSMENIVEKAARKNPHILYIVWSEDFSMDVAAVVSCHESNCVLFVQNLLPSSLSDVYSLSQDFKLQTPKVNVGIFSKPLHCFDFGDLGLPMKISKDSAFESFAKVESKMKKFARTKGMDLVNILSHPEDANSWCNQLLQQLKGRCIISDSP